MSEAAAPAPAPSAPASAPAAPSAPSGPSGADPRGAPPRGHKWASPASPPAGKVAIPSTPSLAGPPSQARPAPQRSAQEISTGQPAKPQPAAAKPGETQAQRQARLEKFKTADGNEVEVDVAEFVERFMSTEKRKVKVNGQEREYSLKEALERLPLGEGAHERFREASAKENQAKAIIERAKKELAPLTDTKQALGILERIHGKAGAQRMMEEYLAAQYQREAMPEADRKALEARERGQAEVQTERQKLEQERGEFEARKQAEQQERYQGEVKRETERIQRDFPILLKEAGLPVTPRMLGRLAEAAAEARALKIPYTEKQLAEHVAKEYREEVAHFGEVSDPETLRTTLGKGADKIRQAEVDRVMSQPGRGKPMIAKPGKQPPSIKTPDQLKKWLHARDLEAERRR